MAADYIQKMRAIQVEGVWNVRGWSFGGAVAYEIAHQLSEAGEPGGLMAAIDADSLDGRVWNDLNVSLLNSLRTAFPQASMAIAPIEDKGKRMPVNAESYRTLPARP